MILCKTSETAACIPAAYRDKCRVQLEIGTEPGSSTSAAFKAFVSAEIVKPYNFLERCTERQHRILFGLDKADVAAALDARDFYF